MASSANIKIVDQSELGVLRSIGEGGQGIVYSTPGVDLKWGLPVAYKAYHQSVRGEVRYESLARMIARVNQMDSVQAEKLLNRCAWPVALVRDSNGFCGFLMPLAPPTFTGEVVHAANSATKVVCRLEFLLNDEGLAPYVRLELDTLARLRLLQHVAETLGLLHEIGASVPDVSAKNLLYSPLDPFRSFYVDCDSMTIDGTSAHMLGETLDWSAGHIKGGDPAVHSADLYKFGLLVLRVLERQQSRASYDPTSSKVPKSLRQILERALDPGVSHRPSASAWSDALKEVRG